MRIALAALALSMLIALPSEATELPTNAHQFGNRTCSQKVPCSDTTGYTSASTWAKYGNSCIEEAFGYTNPDGFFDTTSGVDSNGCLSSTAGAIPKGVGKQFSHRCCVIKVPATKACHFKCILFTQE